MGLRCHLVRYLGWVDFETLTRRKGIAVGQDDLKSITKSSQTRDPSNIRLGKDIKNKISHFYRAFNVVHVVNFNSYTQTTPDHPVLNWTESKRLSHLEFEREKGRACGDGGEVCCAAPAAPPEGVVGVWGAGASPIM